MTLAFISSDDMWVMAAGVLCNVACALLGCYLILRRMALLGDAISHAILPGLAIAFILTGSRNVFPMFCGALVVGVATTFLTQTLHQWGRVPEDSSMGVVFTSLFALGVLLITYVASSVDLDPGCVLYGDIGATPAFPLIIAGHEWPIPRQVAILLCVLVIDLGVIFLFYKELKVVSFDPMLATTMGINATLVHYMLMTLVAGTCVAAFESVGSILVVAMLIAPPAAAHLLTDRLPRMLMVSAGIAAFSAIAGYLIAAYVIDTPPAAMMAVVAGFIFTLTVFLAPKYGFISRRVDQARLALRIASEDILGMLYRWEESRQETPLQGSTVLSAMRGGVLARIALRSLRRSGRIELAGSQALRLTPQGQGEAKRLVRAHRLWESYLNKHFGLPLDHLHAPAERMEHYVTPALQERIAAEIGHVPDPHGREIPPVADSDDDR
jgi:manganese/zinc/iron transport system permease protein